MELKFSDYFVEGGEELVDLEFKKMDKDDEVDLVKLVREKNYKKFMDLLNEKFYEVV